MSRALGRDVAIASALLAAAVVLAPLPVRAFGIAMTPSAAPVYVEGRQIRFERLGVADAEPVAAVADPGLRDLLAAVGAKMTWEPRTRFVALTRADGEIVTFTVGSNAMTVDGTSTGLPFAPFYRGTDLFVPLQPLAQALGLEARRFRGGYVFVPRILSVNRKIGLARTIVEIQAAVPIAWHSAFHARSRTLSLSFPGFSADSKEVPLGNRKDIRNAVEAAHAARGWSAGTAHTRAQILYYMAENLASREDEFARRIVQQTGRTHTDALHEVQTTLSRLFSYAAWADKFEGVVHRPPMRGVVLAMPEPMGVIGVACPNVYPLLGFISLVAPAIAMGNAIVVVPSQQFPLSATDCYQVFETSDLPSGVVNIVTGERDTLSQVLAEHDDVDAMWYFGSAEGSKRVEFASAGNMKRTWVSNGHERDWLDAVQIEGQEFLREATQVKNIWVPYGE